MGKHLATIAAWKTKTQGGYERAILDEEHTPPPHLAHLYTYKARGCYARLCACTGACREMGMFDKYGRRYFNRKQIALLKKRARKARTAIKRAFRDHKLWSQRNKLC